MNETTFQNKCQILSEVWLNYRDDEEFADFIEYCDLGLPLAYAIANDIIVTTDKSTGFVDETFGLFLSMLGVEENTAYESLDDLLETAEDNNKE